MLSCAITAESFGRIVDGSGNPAQVEIVAADEDGNWLVLTGPGSGKTRVIVRRCAYRLRVLRIQAHRILVLCFNCSAALELRRRLTELVGDDARGVTVQTYHGFAMRLTGHSYAERFGTCVDGAAGAARREFDALIGETVDLLQGRTELLGIEADAVRDRLLAGYRHILVDEYQDIDADQYRPIAAIAGRGSTEEKLTLLAVGDDDQNSYAFRGVSVEYIRRSLADEAGPTDTHMGPSPRDFAHPADCRSGCAGRTREPEDQGRANRAWRIRVARGALGRRSRKYRPPGPARVRRSGDPLDRLPPSRTQTKPESRNPRRAP